MKLFFSEFASNYSKYHFPYQVYLIREEADDLNRIYSMGFLPSRTRKTLFYLGRSLRIDLDKFSMSSENRRIKRKTTYIKEEIRKLDDFNYSYKIGKMGVDFYKERFGRKILSAYRIKWLFTKSNCTDVIIYYDKNDKDKVIGYCVIYLTDKILHYAYPFYDLDYLNKNLGIGMMLRSIRWSKENNLKYLYLGTCYTESSLYKTQFSGIEFFNGFKWDSDIDNLKERIRGSHKGHLFEIMKNKDIVFEKNGISI